ncbi:MAG: ABC transporter ATP-binding protein [Gammaproteobacteria bacterium]
MLSVSGLNQFYGESHTLWDLALEIPPGSCTCLMGRNGVGKTTLLKCIMGLLPVRSGSIRIGDVDLTRAPAERRARLGVGYVPQGREIFPLLTVEENLRIGLGAGRTAVRKVPDLVFELFPVLARMLRRRGGDLSGGQQQQLAIGRALVLDPEILILDEPTEGIQPNIVHEIGDIILRLNRQVSALQADIGRAPRVAGALQPQVEAVRDGLGQMGAAVRQADREAEEIRAGIARLNREFGMTVLLVEQKLPFARRVASRFSIMEKGRIVAGGGMSELEDTLIRQYLSV